MLTFKRSAGVLAAALMLGACDDFFTVPHPTVIDAEQLDPVADAPVLARSAQQNLASSYGWLIMYSSWFTGETDVSETFPTRNEFGRRAIAIQNGSLNADVWFPLSQSVASAMLVLDSKLPDPESNINYARAHFVMGYALVFMAEHFCRGTIPRLNAAGKREPGPELNTAAMLDTAINHFNLAISRGSGAAAANPPVAEGTVLANAARVGLARAQLQAGRLPQAIAAAQSVPAGFSYSFNYIDDLAQRTRLANKMWIFVRDRGSIAVAPIWRTSDPRVRWLVTTAFSPQDAAYSTDRGVPYAIQQKYPDYNVPIRLASKLEADYIRAEAEGTTAQLALIQARRSAAGAPSYTGPIDANSVRTEFFTQKGFDFYLEGKRLGDFRRHPTNIIGVPVAGSTYWKPGFAPVGNDMCYPLPIQELDNNPNFKP